MNHVGPLSTIDSKRWRRMRENVGSDSMVWIMGIFAVQATDMMMSPMIVMANPLGEEEQILSISINPVTSSVAFGLKIEVGSLGDIDENGRREL